MSSRRPLSRRPLSRCAVVAAALVAAGCSGRSTSSNVAPDAGSPRDTGGAAGIGPGGGTVRSPDGAVTIEIPAGALTSEAHVEVQPIVNTAPGGLGNAFRLLPADITFAVPVRLTFALTAADLKGTTLDAIGVGFAGADGRWRAVNDVTRAPLSVSVLTTHFSDWSRLVGWQLRPPEAHVHSGDHLALQVIDCEPTEDDGITSLLAACTSDDLLTPLVSGWAVDGVPGGDLGVGMLQTNGDATDYLAPIVAGEEAFAVTVNLTPRRGHPQVILVSNVTVSGDALWSGTSHVVFATGPDPSTNSIETHAEFVFERDEAASTDTSEALRVQRGSVAVQSIETDAMCTTRMGPVTFPLLPGDGQLTYFPGGDGGGTFSGEGFMVPMANRTATFETRCTDPHLNHSEERMVGGAWLEVSDGTGTFRAGQSTISFSYSYAGFVNEWTFTR